MPVRLRPVADDEVASFVASTRDGYTLSMVTDAGMGEEKARAKAERDFAMLAPGGHPVAGQQLFIIEESETSERVGRVWLGERFPGQPIGFLYDIEIEGSAAAVSAARRCFSSSRRRAVAGSSRSG